jgi:predicted kinase
MATKLIILRGNSGSGKSTVARTLQERMGYGTALIEQDYIRRKLLRERDRPNQPNIELIAINAQFALAQGYNVILEGILQEERYGAMLRRLIADHTGQAYVYYFDVSLEETFKRHRTKPNAHEFGETELRRWFTPGDLLGVDGEMIIPEEYTRDQTADRIIKDVR